MTSRRVEILDFSSWNGQINYPQLKAQDADLGGGIVKATEGGWQFSNPHMDQQAASILSTGDDLQFYTFWRPAQRGRSDMDLFIQRIAPYKPSLIWVDAEVSDGLDPYTILTELLDDLAYLRTRFGYRVGVYSAKWWMDPNTAGPRKSELAQYALWDAGYVGSLDNLQIPEPWAAPVLWQYTDNWNGMGIDASLALWTDDQWDWIRGKTPALPAPVTPVPAATRIRQIQAALHAVETGAMNDDTHRRALGIRAMRSPANHAFPDKVRYAQQVMAFGGKYANGIWDPNTGAHWRATMKQIQLALGVNPITSLWDPNTDLAYGTIDKAA